MASKRHMRHKSCECKRQYATFNDALAASRGAIVRTGETIHAYKCKFGNHWHIGHAMAHTLRAMRARREGK